MTIQLGLFESAVMVNRTGHGFNFLSSQSFSNFSLRNCLNINFVHNCGGLAFIKEGFRCKSCYRFKQG